MKKLIIGCTAACLLLAPAAFADKPADAGSKSAAKACKAERSAMGAENFALTYGSNKNRKNAFGKCVSRTAREQAAQASTIAANAAKACKAEQAADPVAFTTKYGTNGNGKNAFGKCVSAKADDLQDEQNAADAAELNAARQCHTEQKADPVAFRTAHGTNKNGSNAFGKCVSALAEAAA
ncbi:MAG: hypothetical protein QOG62_1075 [Thermoleophilaceae bacterium]|jgi:hypothetical protein|nr:hypothetical protein [Thermoleophilaceae bacterium]